MEGGGRPLESSKAAAANASIRPAPDKGKVTKEVF